MLWLMQSHRRKPGPAPSENPRRLRVPTRFTFEERAELGKRAALAGLSMAEYLRRAALAGPRAIRG